MCAFFLLEAHTVLFPRFRGLSTEIHSLSPSVRICLTPEGTFPFLLPENRPVPATAAAGGDRICMLGTEYERCASIYLQSCNPSPQRIIAFVYEVGTSHVI